MASVAWRRVLQGVAFVVVVFLLLGLTVVKFQQRLPWQRTTNVSLLAPRAGTQLEKNADVKLRGIVVGRVSHQGSSPQGAVLTLSFDPSQTSLIPRNVSARILPKTLFGEKYVDLVIPPTGASADHLRAGDSIGLDRSASALEVEKVLADLFPLLRSLQPEKLSRALTAISDGLKGKGEELGKDLAALDTLLAGYEPEIPTFQQDLSGLADLAESLDINAPDLLRLARDATVSARTVVSKGDLLSTFLRGTAGFSGTIANILETNESRLIYLAKSTRVILTTVNAHRAELPSDVHGLEMLLRNVDSALSVGPALNIRLEVVPNRGAYTVADRPSYPQSDQAGGPDLSDLETLTGLIGAILDVPPDEVPPVVDLLWGPILRGSEVDSQ